MSIPSNARIDKRFVNVCTRTARTAVIVKDIE